MENPLLRVENLKKFFPIRKGVLMNVVDHVRAVDGVSFQIAQGQTLGLAGESGCGKTTVGRCILRLVEPSGGVVYYDGATDLLKLTEKEMLPYRKDLQMIFQNPYASLNPRMTVGGTLSEPLKIFRIGSGRKERRARVAELLEQVGLAEEHIDKFPHEFSGGQRQRIAIARSLALNPKLIIADEPVSALDVSIQAQILNLLKDLQQKLGLSYIFISHNLGVVQFMSDYVAIMYLGKIVETSSKEEIYRAPKHPYTKTLMAAIPIPDPSHKRASALPANELGATKPPTEGCRFYPRCSIRIDRCKEEEPELRDLGGTFAACHRL